MPFRHLMFNRRNGAPRRPADFVPPTLDSIQDFSLEDEFPVYNWSDAESPAHIPAFMQQTPQDQPLKPLPSGSAWVNDNPTATQTSTGERYGSGHWAVQPSHGQYQTSQFGSSLDLNTHPGLYTGSQGSVASSISSYSSFDLTSFSGDDVQTMSSDSRRQSTTSMSDVAPGTNTSSLCPLLTGQVGVCKPSLCGPDAPCLNFTDIVPPIEECAISIHEDEGLVQEFDGLARPLSTHSQEQRISPQPIRVETPISQQPRRTSTRTKRPAVKSFRDAPVSDTRTMKKSKARQAHSLVERKYRENLNAKIQELHERLQTTSLSIRARRRSSTSRSTDDSDIETDLAAEELRTNIKAKKSDVLVEAMGYVEASEAEMRQMRSDMKQLQDKINILENMIMRHDCNMPATAPGNVFTYD